MGVNRKIQKQNKGEGKSHRPGILHGKNIMCRIQRQKEHNNVQ